MNARSPSSPDPALPSGNVAPVSTGRPAEIAIARLADRAVAFEGQAERVELAWQLAQAGFARCWASVSRSVRSPSLASSVGSSGTFGGGAGMYSPSSRRTTQ